MTTTKKCRESFFAIAKGCGFSNVDSVSAFDHALIDAGIGNCNLVPVSSIIPAGALRLEHVPDLAPGTIVHCVLAKLLVHSNETGVVCLGYSLTNEYGIVAETSGIDSIETNERCARMLKEMASKRPGQFCDPVIEVQQVECGENKHACGLVVLLLISSVP